MGKENRLSPIAADPLYGSKVIVWLEFVEWIKPNPIPVFSAAANADQPKTNPPKWSCGRLDQQRISFFAEIGRNPTKIRKKSNKSTQVYLWWCGLLDRQRPTAAGFCHKPPPPPIQCQGFPTLERALCRIITKFKLHSQVSMR